MGEQGKETTTTNSASASASTLLCEECKLKESKYKCPGCSIRSCSLPCIKAHKLRTSCTGKRPQTHFVPLSQFDDNLLISDYNMLEDVKRVAESAQRMRLKLTGLHNFRLPWNLKSLRSAAASRGMRIQFLSSGMSKREKNKSFYDNRKKIISWTIEWRFHPTDVVLIDHGVPESTNLCSVIENHLKPGPWNHQLKLFCKEPLESLKFFVRKYYKGQKSPYRELDINSPIRQQLSNLVLLEYPVIHVFLPSHPINFQVIKDLIPPKRNVKESVSNSELSPKGVTFREEEIDDDSSKDPQVLDLMKQIKPDGDLLPQITHQTLGGPRKELRPCLARVGEDSKHAVKNDACVDKANSGFKTKEAGDLESMEFDFDCDFDFEQGLIDAYSDLISETNPDDFLDLEGVFTEGVELEELEEGEIPGF